MLDEYVCFYLSEAVLYTTIIAIIIDCEFKLAICKLKLIITKLLHRISFPVRARRDRDF